MAGFSNLFKRGQWYSGIDVAHHDIACFVWFLEEYYDSDGTKGHSTLIFTSKTWRSNCFKSNKNMSF